MAGFRQAVETADLDAAVACLAPDVVFRSPVVFKPYEGREAVRVILGAVFEVFEDFRYTDEIVQDDRHVLVFAARVGEREVQGIDLLRLGDDGLVAELTVLVRPMSGMHALAEAMRERLEAASA